MNLTCVHTHPQLVDKFSSFYANLTYVTESTYWRRWPYSLQISDYSKYEFFCHYLTVIWKIFSRNFPQKFILLSSIILPAAQNHIYKDSVTSDTQSNTALSLQIFFPHASADSWLRQSRYTWPATIRRYGLQRAVCDQIIPNDDGDQNFGGLLAFWYLCNRLWLYHSSSYHKDNTFIVEEVRIMCSCK